MADLLSDKAQKALRLFENGCLPHRNDFESKLRRQYRAYEGILEQASDAAEWTSKLHPPFIRHIVESTLAGLVDTRMQFRVKPRPRFWNPGEFQSAQAGAKAHEILLGAQLKNDRFNEKMRPFALQDLIYGVTVMKSFYRREYEMAKRLKLVPDPMSGLPRLVEEEYPKVACDGPTSEVVNVEDFFWHEAATELQRAPVIAHRVWMHLSELKANQYHEDNNPSGFRMVDKLEPDPAGEAAAPRHTDSTSRSKDMVEVLEIWWREDDGSKWTVTLGNRKCELRPPKKNPFWHGDYPFVVCSTQPDLFRIPAMSVVEKIEHLQEAHWDLENQTRDNVRLINNAIIWVNSDFIPDPDSLEFAPGARWPVEGPIEQAIGMWSPNPISSDMALPHLARLEQQMQNLAGSQPFTSTSEARNQGADTATEAALTTNLAQRATIAMKEQINYALERVGQQWIHLNQQFIRVPQAVEVVGLDNQEEQVAIMPHLLNAADYMYDASPMNESLMRAERRAEANAFFQLMMAYLPINVSLAQAGAATPVNIDEAFRYVLENMDIQDPERFFSARQPQAALPAGPQQPGQAPSGQAPAGITGPGSIDPAVSPSGQASQSPQVMMSRALASNGGLNNLG